MASPQIPPWLLMNNPNQPTQPLRLNGPLNISLDNPNPGMSLEDANSVIAQQGQAANMGLAPLSQTPMPRFTSERTPQEDELIKQISESYGQQQALQNEAIKSAEEQLAAARSQPQQMDLSPLIALSESWSGKPSRLLQTYQRPQDQSKNVQALQEAVLKARGGSAELSRMRAKDVQQLSQQERQMRVNEDLKRMSIQAMMSGKDKKVDDKTYERELALIDKISKSKDAEVVSGTAKMNNALDNYMATIEKNRNNLNSAKAVQDIGQAYQATIVAFKDAETLGALSGPDMGLATTTLPDVGSYSAIVKRGVGFTPDLNTTLKIVKDIKNRYQDRGQQAMKNLEAGYGKFGGQEVLKQLRSNLEGGGQQAPDRQQQLMQEMQRRKQQGGS
jgi:hypothetical protein